MSPISIYVDLLCEVDIEEVVKLTNEPMVITPGHKCMPTVRILIFAEACTVQMHLCPRMITIGTTIPF